MSETQDACGRCVSNKTTGTLTRERVVSRAGVPRELSTGLRSRAKDRQS